MDTLGREGKLCSTQNTFCAKAVPKRSCAFRSLKMCLYTGDRDVSDANKIPALKKITGF